MKAPLNPNTQIAKKAHAYDLEERLLNYAAEIIRFTDKLPNTRAANHIAGQLLRSGTSPLSNHAEAQAAESQADFLHKLKICLKEFRESLRWLRRIQRAGIFRDQMPSGLAVETDELIRIFVASIRTSRNRGARPEAAH